MMNSKKWTSKIVIIVLMVSVTMMIVLSSCDDLTGSKTNSDNLNNPTQNNPVVPVVDSVDPAFWFGEIYDVLINSSLGGVAVDDNGTTSRTLTGAEMGQAANCQYVCNAINAKWQTSYTPVAGTALYAATCEYLLKMIDKANRNTTSFGTSSYATEQVIDKTAVDAAVQNLWRPAGKFVAIAYYNQCQQLKKGTDRSASKIASNLTECV
jgi:hypothetical protein